MAFIGWQMFILLFHFAICAEAFTRGMICGDFGWGRPDILHNGEWGSIGNTGWDDKDATVFCRSLGYGSGNTIPSSKIYNRRRIIWLSNVDCNGNETSLDECAHSEWNKTTEDPKRPASEIIAGVQCSNDLVRISGGESQGRVEMFNDGKWGSVAADHWDDKDATVFCSMLGYRMGKSTRLPAVSVAFEKLDCTGSETSLNQCPKRTPQIDAPCDCAEDVAGVICKGEMVRIVGSRKKGRAEIFYDDKWGTICDSPGNNDAATVFCRMLGFWTGRYPSHAETVAPPNTPIWAEKFMCTGNESTLAQCGYQNLKNTSCNHDQDIEVSCSNVQVRITPSHDFVGRAEVFFKGQWLPICASTMTNEVAQVFCRTLGLRFAKMVSGTKVAYNQLHLAHLKCSGEEDSIQECTDIRWASQPCEGERSDALIQCTGDIAEQKNSQQEVILYHGNTTYSTCTDNWDDTDATVYCRMLGFSEGVAYKVQSPENISDIRLTNINCVGDEFSLQQCPYELLRDEPCGVNDVAAANCTGSLVRIVNQPGNENKGRAEIFFDDQWGSICDDYWDDKAASVFCRMLGYKKGVLFDPYDTVPERTGPIWLSDVTCTGSESNILQCGHTDWADHQCIHEYDTGVECFSE